MNIPYYLIEFIFGLNSFAQSYYLLPKGGEWKTHLTEAVQKAASYTYIHIIADQGAALLPLWKKMEWDETNIKSSYINKVARNLRKWLIAIHSI